MQTKIKYISYNSTIKQTRTIKELFELYTGAKDTNNFFADMNKKGGSL